MNRLYELCLIAVACVGPATEASAQRAIPSDPVQAVTRMRPAAALADGRTIVIVDQDDEPVTTGSVLWLPRSRMLDKETRELRTTAMQRGVGNIEEMTVLLACVVGTRYKADAQGRAKVPAGEAGTVVAITGRAIGLRQLRKGDGADDEYTVRTERHPEIAVRVVGTDGRPVRGVPVVLQRADSDWVADFSPRGISDRTGMAFVPITRTARITGRAQVVMAHYPALVTLPDAPVVVQDWVRDPEGREPIVLKVPPVGQLRLQVRGADGASIPDLTGAKARADGSRRWDQFDASHIAGSQITFSAVGLGLQLSVTIERKDGSRTFQVAGPQAAGEMAVRTIDLSDGPPPLEIRLIGRDGKPVTKENVGIVFSRPGNLSINDQSTDASGSLKLAMREDRTETGTILTIIRRSTDDVPAYRGAARVEIDKWLAGDKTGIVDVQLDEEPVILAGRVVDTEGQPVAGVRLRSEVGYAMRGQFGMSKSMSADDAFSQHTVESGADGQFAMRELGDGPAAVELQLTKEGWFIAEGASFAPGTTDATVVIGQSAQLAGRFAAVPGDARLPIDVVLTRGDSSYSARPNSDGKFEVHGVAPGKYSLVVRLRGSGESILELEEVELTAGQRLEHPALQDIDWTPFGKQLAVTVQDENGRPVKGTVWEYVVKKSGGTNGSGHWIDDGKSAVFAPNEGAKVFVVAPGYLAQRFPALTEDRTVTLRKAPQVTIELGHRFKLPSGVHLYARPSFEHGQPHPANWGYSALDDDAMVFDSDGRASFRPQLTGKWKILVHARKQGEHGFHGRQTRLEFEFEITAEPTLQRQALELDEDEIDALEVAIEQAAERK